MEFTDLGLIEYSKAWEFQEKLFNNNIQAKAKGLPTRNHLLFCEHPHVITIGKNGNSANLLYPQEFLNSRGVSLFHIDRGGDITYHGPGQLVAYPIFDLEHFGIGLKQYVHNLEEIMILLSALYGIKTSRIEKATGVWIEDCNKPSLTRKIGAIGVRSSRFITMHGFALNVNTDMSYFSLINPCGFVDKGVTSLQKETNSIISMEKIKIQTKALFEDIFD
ncbi:lipoyl(octanoyl) transferase LipB [Dysgonomonas sp. 216]|uniref:lipoyl(octanoyl) transferase LipB n=1 Tax=Dysgonomonas sp. 216 TaxID=2302934 RepID=UPI0013D7D68E|nr:lipoyl(octanoyl) transferase LipB [Dysgonomonas sp. 216]NDW17479.1 lipoyl(octanoyl) transferase LipB [Dysgonomonas sp. 216]